MKAAGKRKRTEDPTSGSYALVLVAEKSAVRTPVSLNTFCKPCDNYAGIRKAIARSLQYEDAKSDA